MTEHLTVRYCRSWCSTHYFPAVWWYLVGLVWNSCHVSVLSPQMAHDTFLFCLIFIRVCKKWHSLVKDKSLWTYVDLTNDYEVPIHSIKQRPRLLQFMQTYLGKTLKSLRTGFCSVNNKVLEFLHYHCPNLQELILEGNVNQELELTLLPESLTCLAIHGMTPTDYPKNWYRPLTPEYFPNLTSISLQDPRDPDQTILQISRLKTLRHLKLVDFDKEPISRPAFLSLVRNLSKLESLSLEGCCGAPADYSQLISRYLINLKRLKLDDSDFVRGEDLKSLVSLRHLETLSVECCQHITFQHLAKTVQAMSSLRNLHFCAHKCRYIRRHKLFEKFAFIQSLNPDLQLYYAYWPHWEEYLMEPDSDSDMNQFGDDDAPDLCSGWDSDSTAE